MKHYELIYIVAGKYAENEVTDISGQVDSLISKHGGTITFTQYWERKKLAYPIDHIVYGHYVISEFDMKPNEVAAFERALQLSADIVRHLVVAKDTIGAPRVMETKPADEDATMEEKLPEQVKDEPVAKKPVEAKAVAPKATTPTTEENAAEPVAEKKEEVDEKAEKEPVTETTEVEEPASKSKKKTDSKVSFEDLDKKLDEILNNDII